MDDKKKDAITLSAVGDTAIFRRDAETMFEYVRPILQEADIKFAQNERHLTYRTDVSGVSDVTKESPNVGFTELADARDAHVLKQGGFDVLSFASNHSMDLGARIMMETVDVLKSHGFAVIGVGNNLEEARKPAFVERKGTKVAFLAYCSALRPDHQAWPNKPGVAPMRADTHYRPKNYQPGMAPQILTFAYRDDLEDAKEDIRKARNEADVVVVSFHWGITFSRIISMYQQEVAYAAIDAGAEIILGHHPHQLKGIEVYKGKPIFYSMGNFAMDLSYEDYQEWGKLSPYFANLTAYHGWEPEPDWSMYNFPPEGRYSMIAKCEIADNNVQKAYFLPVLINQNAQPKQVLREDKEFDGFFEYIKEISEEQGLKTKFSIEGDKIVIDLT